MDGRGAMAASATASSNGSALGILKAIGSLMWAILYILVVLPIQIVLTTLSTLFASIVQYFPLLLILVGLIFIGNTWISSHQQVTQDFEEFWRCELYPVFFGPIPTLIDGLATPYEEAICYYNAVAFTNRILSKKTVTKILAECPTPSSYYHPIIGIVKTLFNTVAAIARWVVGFYKYKLPLWPTLTGLSDVLEIIVRMINCLCEDLHPGFFYVARIISNEHLYCAVDNFVNAAIARVQYILTYAYNLITSILKLIFDTLIFDFESFSTQFRNLLTEVSPVLSIAPERLAMTSMYLGQWLNDVIKSLICTIITEIQLHQGDNTLVNGTVPLPHTAIPPNGTSTFLNETLYFQCMTFNTTYDYNIFGALGVLGSALPRAQFVVEKIFPGGIFRIGVEFFTLPGPISDDGSQGFDINTPLPNDSTRFLLSVTTIDAVWDTIRRPLDTLRTSSMIEKWPNLPLYGANSDQYDPPENTTQSCNPDNFTPITQENLFCTECSFNRTEANVVTQIEILARQIDDLLAPLIEGRRLFTPLFLDIFGGAIRLITAILKFYVDIYRHFFAGVDEFLIFLCRQNYYDVIFDELAGKPHELGGIYNGTVKFFAEIYPSLHIVPKFVVLPLKYVTEFLRNVIRLIPQILNALKGIGGGVTYGPRITEFYCLTGSPYCINVEEQFFKWLRVPRSIQLDVINITKVMRQQVLGQRFKVFDLQNMAVNVTWISVTGDMYHLPLDLSAHEFNTQAMQALTLTTVEYHPQNTMIFRTQETITMPVYDLGLSVLNRTHIEALYGEVANSYDPIQGGDVYYNTTTLLPYQLGWLECIRYFFSTRFINSFITNPLDQITPEQFPDITCGIYYGGRFVVELLRIVGEFFISLFQTIVDAVNIGDPLLPAIVFRWAACTEPDVCIPLLPALSDTEDFVQCPCRFLGATFLNVPCLCNITNSLGLAANSIFRAGLNLEFTASQLIVCLTEFPTGVTSNTTSKACYTIVFDRVIDIFNKTYNATTDAADFGGGLGCLIGSFDPIPCGGSGTSHLSHYTSDMVFYIVEFIFSIIRAVLKVIENFFVFLRGQIIGSTPTNPATAFSFSETIGTILDEVITPLVGSNTSNTSVGAIQSFGNSISCVFSNGTCNITANPTATACSGWFLVKIGNTIRDVYKCLRVIIVDGIGFWEDLFTGQNVSTRILRFLKDGVWCLVTTLITDILDLILTFVGSLLDLIFNTGNSITTFLHNIGTGITTVINILNGLFFQVGQAINCSTCWSVCLSDTWDSIPHSGDPTHAVCSNCWCKCKCQRPTLDGLPCRIDWDGDSHTNDQEVFTPVTAQANCTALGYTYKKKRDLLQSAEYMDLIASHNPDVLSSNNAIPSAALGRARNINATLQELFQWKHMYEEVTQSSSSSSVCTDLMLQIHEKAQKMSPNDNSIDRLLADYSFSDKALFTGCYSLLVAPSLLNDPSGSMMKRSFSSEGPLNSVMSLLKIPKYLFMDSKQLDHFMQASNDALQTYVEWQSNAGLMTVSPVLLQQYIESNSNSSVILYNQTLLTPEQIQKKRAILARFSTFMVRGSPPALIHKREMAAAMDTHIAVHSRSFNDALYLSMTTHHPNVDLFVNQLAQYNLNEKAANQLGELLNRAHQSTVLDGLIEFTQGLRTFTAVLNPIPAWRASIKAAQFTNNLTRDTKSKILRITSNLNMQEAANSTLKVTAYGRYGTRNPSFRVLDGETATEKFNSLVGFYSMIWNDFKFTKMQMAKTNVARALTQVKSTLESSETLIRSVENYQYIQSQFPTNLPVIPKALTAWIANVRTKQGVPLVLSQDTVVGPFIKPSIITQNNATIQGLVTTQDWFNETECNVTRCFRCAVIKTVLVEIKEFFDYCVEIDQGNLSVIKHINITDPIVATSNKTVDDSLILGLGKYINVAVGILFSSNMDPFNNTGEPLGIQFYLTYFVPIPFYSTCDRDINTTCEFGYGFGTGLIVLLLLTLGGLILWFIFPSTAGFLTTIISVVGYVIFALSIVLAVSWGLNPLCLQTPGLSIISFIVPLQLPILPECAVRDIANTLFSVFQQCYQFWKPLITDETLINATTGELTCPVCPGKLPLIDCQTVGFKNGWDEFVFGIYWMLSWFHVPLSVLPALPDGLNITLKLHQACFVWLLPSGAFWLGILVGLFILLPVILAIGMLLYGTYTMFANLAIFSYCY